MNSWFHDHWLPAFGTGASVLVAQASLPENFGGLEKVSSLGLLGIFMWFTLTRMESAIKANSGAIERLIDHLDNKR
jgi:hypothetical protein